MIKAWLSNNAITLAGAAAVLCGLLFLTLTGAPPRLLLINLVALGAGIALLAIARLLPVPSARPVLLLGAAAALLATALFGTAAEGATRWVVIGGLSLQPSLVLLPALILAHVVRPDRWSSLAVALAALAIALQPDRSLAAAIAFVTLLDAAVRRTTPAWFTAAASLLAFAVTLVRPDDLPAVAHVDQILWTSFADQPLAALAIWTGTALLFAPALVLWRRGMTAEAASFTALWACLVASAMLHNYPTPLVGYGAGSILGYLLVALALPRFESAAFTQSADLNHDQTKPGTWRVAATVR